MFRCITGDGIPSKPAKATVKEKLGRKAKRAALLYAKALRKMEKHPAPHGYGDGYYECGCPRCDRAMTHEARSRG